EIAPEPSPQPAPTMAPPIAEPARAPRLKKPWKEDIVGRRRMTSISEACVLMATKLMLAAKPNAIVAGKRRGMLGAKIGVGNTHALVRAAITVVRRDPARATKIAMTGCATTLPRPNPSSASPRTTGSMDRRPWTVG